MLKIQSILFLFLFVLQFGQAQVVSKKEAKKWQQDLRTLSSSLAERHPNLYHTVAQSTFEQAVEDLHQSIPTLTRNQILVGMAKVVALVGDGHTSFFAGSQAKRFRFLPLILWSFPDGIYVIATSKEYTHLFGKRLLQIDQTPIEEAFTAISECIGVDNEMEYQYTVPFELIRPELLEALGIAKSAEEVSFHFADHQLVKFRPMKRKEYRQIDWRTANKLFEGKKPNSARMEFLFATPLSLPHLKQRKYYWYRYLEEEKALFLQYNTCWDQKDRPTFAEMVQEVFQFMEKHPVERFILDIRNNSGGEPLTATALVEGMAQLKSFTDAGKFFVLVGRRTFSAAVTNAVDLRAKAGAIIVGEAPRGKPNHYGEGRDIDLKKTKSWATVSTEFVAPDPSLGDRPFLPVDIVVPLSFADYQQANDPVLEAALQADFITNN